jgi:thioredoxin 1
LSWTDLKDTDWDSTVTKAEWPVVVEFWHNNCPTCKKIELTVHELPVKLAGRARFTRLNVLENRENRRLAIQKGVIGTPTFKIYCGGAERGEVVGLETLNNLEGAIADILKSCA